MAFQTKSSGASTKTPAGMTKGGSSRFTLAAVSSEIQRGLDGQKTKPTTSAPASAATRASAGLVIPQIFTITDIQGPPFHAKPARTTFPLENTFSFKIRRI